MSDAKTEAVFGEKLEAQDPQRRNLAMALLGAWGGAAFLEACAAEPGSSTPELPGHARSLRRDLMRAFGVEKWNEKEGKFEKARRMSVRERELFADSDETKRLDFHSFRRSYSQALADANAQTGMRLACHASQIAHNRYLRNTRKAMEAPAEAMLQISIGTERGHLPLLGSSDGSCQLMVGGEWR